MVNGELEIRKSKNENLNEEGFMRSSMIKLIFWGAAFLVGLFGLFIGGLLTIQATIYSNMMDRKKHGGYLEKENMNENDKDWGNPAFRLIYIALATSEAEKSQGPFVAGWLNSNGFCNLTCCPECHVDDFTHVEGCETAKIIETVKLLIIRQIARIIE
jgi:hypothetical protein